VEKLTHANGQGRARMVDVSDKAVTRRIARASGKVLLSAETLEAIRDSRTRKGDPLETARIAGIMAAKRTAELIPLCHPLLLEHVNVSCSLREDGILLESSVVTTHKTGAEMEALTAVSVAALTVYDMCKALDRGMTIEAIRLESKSGGRRGPYRRPGSERE
jgi:cyclic pyranopterin phosphate synthase